MIYSKKCIVCLKVFENTHKHQVSCSHKCSSKLRIGWKSSEEHKKKISKALKGRKLSKEHIEKMRKRQTGKKLSKETREKMSRVHKLLNSGERLPILNGENSFLWKGGITPMNKKIRSSLEYKLWRKSVFERDNYTCVWCGSRSSEGNKVTLNADHIKPFAYFPELRFAIDNGRTLCLPCHKTTDTFGEKAKKYLLDTN